MYSYRSVTYGRHARSLRSKRFRRFFRPFEAFFAFGRRENLDERNTDGRSGEGEGGRTFFALAPLFARAKQSGTVIKFDNVVTSQHGVKLKLGELSERVPSLRQLSGCVCAIYPELQVVNIREQ